MIGYFDTEVGRVQISPTVVRRFIIREVEKTSVFRFPGFKPGEDYNRKAAEKSIRVNFNDGQVEATLTLSVEFGANIIKEARDLQGRITRAIQLGAGLQVQDVAVNVESVFEHSDHNEALLIEHDELGGDAVNQ